jgi:hypothetical protein
MIRIKDYLPTQEARFADFCTEFGAKIATDFAQYGLNKTEADDYQTTLQRFLEAYAVVQDRDTRTSPKIIAKNDAKRHLINSTRSLVDVIQSWPQMTNEKRESLGIPLRKKSRKPRPAPTTSPFMMATLLPNRKVQVVLQKSETIKGKPANAAGANIFVAFGDEPPVAESGWKFETGTTKTKVIIPFQGEDAERVWITAFWFNAKQESGEPCAPVSVNLPAANVLPKKVSGSVRKAA